MKRKIDELEHQDSTKKKVTQNIDINSIRTRLDAAIDSNNFGKELLLELASLNIAQINNFKLDDSLKKFIDLNNAQSVNVLHVAVSKGNLELVKYLIEHVKVDPMALTPIGNNILHIAASAGYVEVVKYLIEHIKFDLTVVNRQGLNILHLATHKGNLELVKYLIEQVKMDPIALTQMGDNILYIATHKGNLELVKYLIEQVKIDLMDSTQIGIKTLCLATINGKLEVVKYLTEQVKMDPMALTPMGNNILHIAVSKGYLELVKYLIEQVEADPMAVNTQGKNILHLAASEGHLKVVKYLIEQVKVDPMALIQMDYNILHLAVKQGHLELVKYLIEQVKMDPMALTKMNLNILHLAASNGHLEVVKYLIEHIKFDPTIKNNHGNALHLATMRGHLEIIKYLIEHAQVDPTVKDIRDDNILHIAIAQGHLDVVEYIVDTKICDINNIIRGNNNNLSMLLDLRTEKFPGVKEKIMEFLLKNNITVLENDYSVLRAINSNKAQTVQFTDTFYARTIDKDYNKSEIDQSLFITRLTNAFLQDGCKEKNINDSKTEYLKLSTELGLPENLIGSVESMFDKFIDDVLCLEASLLSAKTGNCVASLNVLVEQYYKFSQDAETKGALKQWSTVLPEYGNDIQLFIENGENLESLIKNIRQNAGSYLQKLSNDPSLLKQLLYNKTLKDELSLINNYLLTINVKTKLTNVMNQYNDSMKNPVVKILSTDMETVLYEVQELKKQNVELFNLKDLILNKFPELTSGNQVNTSDDTVTIMGSAYEDGDSNIYGDSF